MKRLAKTLILVMMLIAMPLKQWAQQPKLIKLSEFNISNINAIEERVFVIHSLLEQGYYCYKSAEKSNTVEVFMPNDAPYDLQDFDFFFDNLYNNDLVDFSNLDKSLRGELFIQWRQEIDDDLYRLLYEDFTRGVATENSTCETALPFCTNNGAYTFPAGVNSGSPCGSTTTSSCSDPYRCTGTPGQSTYCLSTAPNPAFYYLKIATTGNLNIKIYSDPRYDIDFDCWGPFDDPITGCSQLSCSNIVDCSYAGGSGDEYCHINNAIPGKYYILLLTNYGNHACNIIFENVGTGTTDCGIMPPLVDNDGPYCVGETIHLSANGPTGATYSWTGPGGFTSSQQNPTRTNCTMNMAGTYTCTISMGGQTNSATTQVVVYARPTANFNYTTVCLGSPTQFTNTSTTTPTGQQITSYQWNFGDGQTSTQQSPSHTYATAGTFTVTLTVGTGGHCTSTKTQTVTVYAQPAANAGPDQTIPYGTIAQLSGSGGAGTFNYHWEPANMVANANAQNTQTVPLTEDQTYTLTVTNPQGQCTDTDEVTIHISGSAMTVTPCDDISICQGGSGQIYVNAGGGVGSFTYSWTPTTGLSNPNIYNPIASPAQTTTYTCSVTDGQTTQSVSVTVTVNEVIVENEYVSICPDDVYNWHGTPCSQIDTYQFDTVTDQGCDKTIYLHLDHYPTYDETTIDTAICFGESYTFYGTTFTQSFYTSYTDHTTLHGCDSIVRLNLTVWDENPITPHPENLCPEQLPFYYDQDPDHEPLYAGQHLFMLEDIHGCDSAVLVNIQVSPYYQPDTLRAYVCTLPYIWEIRDSDNTLITTKTIDTAGYHCDTIQTSACEGIFQLKLNYQPVPEPVHIYDTACNNYRWFVNGTLVDEYDSNAEDEHHISLYPYPCTKDYYLHLIVNHDDDDAKAFDGNNSSVPCDSIPFDWFGNTVYFKENGTYNFFTGDDFYPEAHTINGCDTAMVVNVSNMRYTPNPGGIRCADGSAVVFGDTIAVVTNTEFFSFQYTFFIEESNRECVWQSCNWSITKPSWALDFNPVPTQSFNGKYYSECTVFVADRQDEHVVLTATVNNGCGSQERKFYLKSSFLDVDEYNQAPAKVNIVPNPNNGQMHLDFENMEGRTAIKVFDMTGNQIDAFETIINSNRYNYDYNMKKYAEGIYFFVISNNNRVLTKKVVVIH